MAWARNGTPNTLSGTADDCDITDLTASKFNVFLNHIIPSGTAYPRYTFNDNNNSVYARRQSGNGGADSTGTSEAYHDHTFDGGNDNFVFSYICSISGEEKLGIWFGSGSNGSGATNAPDRWEFVGKFVPSPDADITRIDLANGNSGSSDYATGTNLSAIGTD